MGQTLYIRCYNVLFVVLLFIVQAELGNGMTLVQNKYDTKETTKNNFFPSDGNVVVPTDVVKDFETSRKEAVVGSFRIGYTAPGADEPSTDDYYSAISETLSYLWAIQGYFDDEIIQMGISYDLSGFTYDSDPSADPNIRMVWTDFTVAFNTTNTPPSSVDVFDVVKDVIAGNKTFVEDIQVAMVGTPFEKTAKSSIDNFIEGTPYPTGEPYPTPVPLPTIPPVPIVTVPTGDLIIEYTAPGAEEFNSDDQRSLFYTTYGYLLNILDTIYTEFYSTESYSATYNYTGPDAVPNIFFTLGNFGVQFLSFVKDIPTAVEIQQVLIDSINSTYLELIQQTPGEVFSLIMDATMTFEEGQAASPTVSPLLTEAPVPRSRRGKYGQK